MEIEDFEYSEDKEDYEILKRMERIAKKELMKIYKSMM